MFEVIPYIYSLGAVFFADSLCDPLIISYNLIVLLKAGYWCSGVVMNSLEDWSGTLKGLPIDLCRKAVEKNLCFDWISYILLKVRNAYNMLLSWF